MRFACALVVLLLVGSCSRPSDESQLRANLDAMASAAAAHDASGVLAHVADDFTGNDGDFDRAGLERMLRLHVLGGGDIGVSISAVDVDLAADRATVRFEATLSDGTRRWLPDHRAVFAFVSGWRRDKGDWLCNNAGWTQR